LQAISDHPEGNSLAMIEMLQCRYCTAIPGNQYVIKIMKTSLK
jgi:hypothetical protein